MRLAANAAEAACVRADIIVGVTPPALVRPSHPPCRDALPLPFVASALSARLTGHRESSRRQSTLAVQIVHTRKSHIPAPKMHRTYPHLCTFGGALSVLWAYWAMAHVCAQPQVITNTVSKCSVQEGLERAYVYAS